MAIVGAVTIVGAVPAPTASSRTLVSAGKLSATVTVTGAAAARVEVSVVARLEDVTTHLAAQACPPGKYHRAQASLGPMRR